jgi:hypothetical protein
MTNCRLERHTFSSDRPKKPIAFAIRIYISDVRFGSSANTRFLESACLNDRIVRSWFWEQADVPYAFALRSAYSERPDNYQPAIAGFLQGLQQLGWIEHRCVDFRWAVGNAADTANMYDANKDAEVGW